MSDKRKTAVFKVRRSIHANASPERVGAEFASFQRMNEWWGHLKGDPQRERSNGQWLDAYEAGLSGLVRWRSLGTCAGSPTVVKIPNLRCQQELAVEKRLDSVNRGMARPGLS